MYTKFVSKLEKGETFTFARFGDGEFRCMFGKSGKNCDKHTFFPDMGKELERILYSKPEYYVGIQPHAVRIFEKRIAKYLKGLDYINADIFHKASIHGNLGSFLDSLQDKRVVFVAPEFYSLLKEFKFIHIKIPLTDCWLDRKRIYKEIKKKLTEKTVVLFAASMMTEYLIDLLYNEYKDQHTFLDIGSVLDPYCGKKTRKYHANLNIPKKRTPLTD